MLGQRNGWRHGRDCHGGTSVPLAGRAPSYPGQLPATVETVTMVTDDGYLIVEVHTRTHTGRHADSAAQERSPAR